MGRPSNAAPGQWLILKSFCDPKVLRVEDKTSRVGWKIEFQDACLDWPAMHFTHLVPIKLPPYCNCTGQWLILKSFCGPKVRGLKTKQGYGESVGQSRAPWLGGLEGHNPDDHLRTRFDTISLWPAISSLMMQRLVGRQLHLIYNGTQIWTKLIKRGIICKQPDITCAHCWPSLFLSVILQKQSNSIVTIDIIQTNL